MKTQPTTKPEFKLPAHFMVSECDGGLYDTRKPNWSGLAPLRKDYRRTHSRIYTTAQFKATLRAGGFAWPGGYPLYLITSDGGVLCFKCARNQVRNIFWSMQKKCSDGWSVQACEVNYEDGALTCDHCSQRIESAYAETEANQEESK